MVFVRGFTSGCTDMTLWWKYSGLLARVAWHRSLSGLCTPIKPSMLSACQKGKERRYRGSWPPREDTDGTRPNVHQCPRAVQCGNRGVTSVLSPTVAPLPKLATGDEQVRALWPSRPQGPQSPQSRKRRRCARARARARAGAGADLWAWHQKGWQLQVQLQV